MLLLRSLSRVVREHAMLDLAVDDRERLLDLERMVVEVALLLLHEVAQSAHPRLQRLHHHVAHRWR